MSENDSLFRDYQQRLGSYEDFKQFFVLFLRDLDQRRDKLDDLDKDIEERVRNIQRNMRGIGELNDALNDMSKVTLDGKNLEKIVKILDKFDNSIDKVISTLQDNTAVLEDDAKALLDALVSLDDTQKLVIQNMARNTKLLSGEVMAAGTLTADVLETQTRAYNNLLSSLNAIRQSNQNIANAKLNAKEINRGVKAVIKQINQEISDMSFDMGLDSESVNEAVFIMQDLQRKVTEHEATIAGIQASGQNMTEEALKESMDKANSELLIQVKYSRKKLQIFKEAAEIERAAIEISSKGYGELASAAKQASDAMASGLSSLRSGDLVSAFESFKESRRISSSVAKAAKANTEGSTGFMKFLNQIVEVFTKFSVFSSIIMGVVQVLLEARDRTMDLNKQISEVSGLAGMGIDLEGTVDPSKMTDTFFKYRDQIIGESKNLFNFPLTVDEKVEIVKGLGQFVNLQDQAGKDGQSLESAIHSVATYSGMLGMSTSEVSEQMGRMYTMMGTGMDKVSLIFADLTRNWQGTRMGIGDFMEGVSSITTETPQFGNRMVMVSKMMNVVAKNGRLGGKYAMESVKSLFSLGEKLDRGRMAQVESSMGTEGLVAFARKELQLLQSELDKETDDKAKENLKLRMSQINADIGRLLGTVEGTYSPGAIMSKLPEPKRIALAIKQLGSTIFEDGALGLARQTDATLSKGSSDFMLLAQALGAEHDELDKVLNSIFSYAPGAIGQKRLLDGLDQIMTKTENDLQSDNNDLDNDKKKAAELAKQTLTTEKALNMITEAFYLKIGNGIENLSKMVREFVRVLTNSKTSAETSEAITEGFKTSPEVSNNLGSLKFDKDTDDLIKLIQDYKAGGGTGTGSLNLELAQQLLKSDPQYAMAMIKALRGDFTAFSSEMQTDKTKQAELIKKIQGLGINFFQTDKPKTMSENDLAVLMDLPAVVRDKIFAGQADFNASESAFYMNNRNTITSPDFRDDKGNLSGVSLKAGADIKAMMGGKVLSKGENSLQIGDKDRSITVTGIDVSGFKEGQDITEGQNLGKATSGSRMYGMEKGKKSEVGGVISRATGKANVYDALSKQSTPQSISNPISKSITDFKNNRPALSVVDEQLEHSENNINYLKQLGSNAINYLSIQFNVNKKIHELVEQGYTFDEARKIANGVTPLPGQKKPLPIKTKP